MSVYLNLMLLSGEEQEEEVILTRHLGTGETQCLYSLSSGSHEEGCQETCRTGILTISFITCSDIFINLKMTLGPTVDNKRDDNQKIML